MKLCFWIATIASYGGVQRVTSVVANALAKHHEVTIVTMDPKEKINNIPYYLNSDIQIIAMPGALFNRPLWYRIFTHINRKTGLLNHSLTADLLKWATIPKDTKKNLLDFFQAIQPDVLVGVAFTPNLWLTLIADQLDAKTCIWQHNSFDAYFHTPHQYLWHQQALYRANVHSIDSYVVLNQTTKQKVDQAFDLNSIVIHNPKSFQTITKSNMKNTTFLVAGRLEAVKGIDTLIRAFSIFACQNKDWNCLIVGDGNQKENLIQQVKNAHLEDRISFHPFTDHIQSYFEKASVFLLPSRWEGMPLVVLEALEFGCPVIAFAIEAMKGLIEDGKEGLIVSSIQNEKAFAKAMLEISQDEKLRWQFHQNAIQKAQKFDIDVICAKWEELFATLTTKK